MKHPKYFLAVAFLDGIQAGYHENGNGTADVDYTNYAEDEELALAFNTGAEFGRMTSGQLTAEQEDLLIALASP